MMEWTEKLLLYLSYPFVRYALIAGVLIALCSSLLGVTLVLKRFSFIGDGLSHVAFGAMAAAAVLQVTNHLLFILAVTMICAVLLLLIAVIIVLAMNLVGSLLISALVIFPALSAMRVFRTFRVVTVCSSILSVCCAFAGILISILTGMPVGATIVAVNIVGYVMFCGAGKIAGR